MKYNLTDQELLDLTVGEFVKYSERYGAETLWLMVLAAKIRRQKLVKFRINPYFTFPYNENNQPE